MSWRVGEIRLYRWANSFEWLVLLAIGWRIEFVDERYGSVLMSCVESEGARLSAEVS